MRSLFCQFVAMFIIAQFGCSAIRLPATLGETALASDVTHTNEKPTLNEVDPPVVDQVPARIAAIWNEELYTFPGKKPVRGYTGRLYFYNKQDQLLKVDGDLKVYGYNDSESRVKREPDHTFLFTREELKEKYNPSELGHSYALWIPWPETDRYRKQISLVPAIKTVQGDVALGTLTRLVLRGKEPPRHVASNSFSTRAATYTGSKDVNTQPKRRSVETLAVPPEIARRLDRAQQNISRQYFAPESHLPSEEATAILKQLSDSDTNPDGHLYNQLNYSRRKIRSTEPKQANTVDHARQNQTENNTQQSSADVKTDGRRNRERVSLGHRRFPIEPWRKLNEFGKTDTER